MLRGRPLRRVVRQGVEQQAAQPGGQCLWQVGCRPLHVQRRPDFCRAAAAPRRRALQHVQQRAAKRPHVRLRRHYRLGVHLLRAHVVVGARDARRRRHAHGLQRVADATVREHNRAGGREERVVGLQVHSKDLRGESGWVRGCATKGCGHVGMSA
eukprot:350237-Chlamydomonas_euryale.AAC.1